MPCPTCAFDLAAWSQSDLRRTLNDVEPWFHQLAEGAPADVQRALQPIACGTHSGRVRPPRRERSCRSAPEGHPIGYGSTGENLTLRGLDWRTIRPGVRLQVGGALLETTPYAIPCKKNAQWFLDGRFRRMSHDVAPGTSRIYARVLVEGTVAVNDRVLVEPLVLPA